MRFRSGCCVVLFLMASAARAAQVRVHLTGDRRADCLGQGALVATQSGSPGIRVPLEGGKTDYAIEIPGRGTWQLAIDAAGCWSERQPWSPDDQPDLILRAYKASAAEGDIDSARAGKHPDLLQASVLLLRSTADALPPGSSSDTTCSISEYHWRCTVPAAVRFDLRLDFAGYAAVYYWDTLAEAGRATTLPRQRLYAGGSIAGWVRDSRDRPIRDAKVTCLHTEAVTSGHVSAQLHPIATNGRGFFQCTGLAEGQHRIIVESAGWSPASLSDIPVRSGETLTLPKPIRPVPFGEVAITLDPAADRRGKPWSVELTEQVSLYPNRLPRTIAHAATARGTWEANGLRADVYDVIVKESGGTPVAHSTLDLFGGGKHATAISVRPVWLSGVVRAGDTPLKADLFFNDFATGKFVKASADGDGRFDATLPTPGKWGVNVLYPPGRHPARIQARTLEIPDDAAGTNHEVQITIPGGRIHGRVVGQNGESGTAAVHARRDVAIVSQQMADDDGSFDLIGLAAGTYQLDAQNKAGSTPAPVEVHLDENESRELTLTTEATVTLSGTILTPDGRPASGAVLRLSGDGGWITMIADVGGRFEYSVQRSARLVQVIALSYDYPAAMLTAPLRADADNELTIRFRSDGGTIRCRQPGDAVISAHGVVAALGLLRVPERYGQPDASVYVESGAYTMCQRRNPSECRAIAVAPGSAQDVDLSVAEKERP